MIVAFVLDTLIGLLNSLPPCSHCTKPATKAFDRGQERFCDEHGTAAFLGTSRDAPDYPRAPWIRRLSGFVESPRKEYGWRLNYLRTATFCVTAATADLRCENLRREARARIEELTRLAEAALIPGDPDELLRGPLTSE